MSSPLFPVIASIQMDWFEHLVLQKAPCKLTHFYHYVGDTFWLQGHERLGEFLIFLDGIHGNIKFIMEVEQEGKLSRRGCPTWIFPFTGKEMCLRGRQCIANPLIQTILEQQQPPSSLTKKAMLSTLVHRAYYIPDSHNPANELKHLRMVFLERGMRRMKLHEYCINILGGPGRWGS